MFGSRLTTAIKGNIALVAVAAGAGIVLSCMSGVRVAPHPQTPFDMALALEHELASGAGVLLPDPYTPYVRDCGVLPLPAPDGSGFPQGFVEGLAGVVEHGVTVYPVTLRVDDASGQTLFRNADGVVFWVEFPAGPYSPDWVARLRMGAPESRGGRDWGLMEALYLPSHVEMRWVFAEGEDVPLYTATRASQRTRQTVQVQTRQLSTTEPDLKITAFSIVTNVFHFTVAWNGLMHFPCDAVTVLYSQSLTDADWLNIGIIDDLQGGTAGAVHFEIPFDDMPFAWNHTFGHDPNCVPVTNIVESVMFAGEFHTNIVCACTSSEEQSPTGFFKVQTIEGVGWGWPAEEEILVDPPEDFDYSLDTGDVEWVILTGDLGEDEVKTLETTLDVLPGQMYLVAVYTASEEYPDYTGDFSQWNDTLAWEVTCPDPDAEVMSGSINVNDRHAAWDEALLEGISMPGGAPAWIEDLCLIVVPEEDEAGGTRAGGGTRAAGGRAAPDVKKIEIVLQGVNIADGALPSTVGVVKIPVKLHQHDMPNFDIPFSPTDKMQGKANKVEIGFGRDAVAYIRGRPEVPVLRASLSPDAPGQFFADWTLAIVTERPEFRQTTDDRQYKTDEEVPAHLPWHIEWPMREDIVGGKCTLTCKISHKALSSQKSGAFFIRGKNPLDADVEMFFNGWGAVGAAKVLKLIAIHESRQTEPIFENGKPVWWLYNQFNSINYETAPYGTLNKTYYKKDGKDIGNGWGIVQLDASSYSGGIIPTALVWNWQANVTEMARIFDVKLNDHKQFMKKYWEKYTECPPSPYLHPEYGIELFAEEWGALVLYNGPLGLPKDDFGNRSPWQYDSKTKKWTLYDNVRKYAKSVSDDIKKIRQNEVIIRE